MKKIKITPIRYSIAMALISLLCTGCNDWLNVNPKTEVGSEELFKVPSGFDVALNGIYVNLSSRNFYGGHLNYGTVDVMARLYTTENPLYNEFMEYSYDDASVKSQISSTWSTSYNLIANCNNILYNLDTKDPSFYLPHQYEMFKGQTLAARAALYFQLVRLFAPAVVKGDSKILPYYTEVTHIAPVAESTKTILTHILSDLQAARDLMSAFDTSATEKNNMKTLRFSTTKITPVTSIPQGYRFSYYSVTALLARVALYAGDTDLALTCAKEVIDSKLIQFTTSQKITSNKYDRLFSEDIIQAFYNTIIETESVKVLGNNTYLANYTQLFDAAEVDFRKKLTVASIGESYQTIKYAASENTTLTANVNYMIPFIRLSEMYYIVAEVEAQTDVATALKTLTVVRKARGLKTTISASNREEFMDLLWKDFRREFISEGQLFFFYKRLNRPVVDEKAGNRVLDEEFTWPVPENETVG